jgi:aminoglycoside phosphotransferase
MHSDKDYVAQLANCLVKTCLNDTVRQIEPLINKGEVNDIYVLTTQRSDRVILRLNKPSEYQRFLKEQWCMDTLSSRGVFCPRVLAVDSDKMCAYMLMEFIDGENGDGITSTLELWQELGRMLRLIHALPVQGFGEDLDEMLHGTRVQWTKHLEDNISALADKGNLMQLDGAVSVKLQTLFRGLLGKQFTFGLNHGDYSLANIIVDAQSKPCVIDWGSAQAHVIPHHDLGVITEESLSDTSKEFTSLLNGYGMSVIDYQEIKDEIHALQLLETIDKLRWARDKAPQRIDYFMQRLRWLLKRGE